MIKERSNSQQLVINMAASLVTFVVGLGIRFILTPYIVRVLGAEAYGFIGLSANILSYTGLVTIALNSMAGRFVTIKYCSGDIENANRYYASVFYSNIFLAILILLFSVGCIIWLEYILVIPSELIFDVKFLFLFLAINNIVGLLFGIWGVSTFIKNRLDLSNIRNIIGNLINAAIIVFLFTLLSPHIWFIGVAGFVMTCYTTLANRQYARLLTPELTIKRSYYDWNKVKELLKSGVWNLTSKLGEILGQGLDLLIANICISATAMGYFALTKNVPFLILSLFQSISGIFSPTLTNMYANGETQKIVDELKKSIRILSFFTALPLCALYIYGDSFYHLWIPSEDASMLQQLTILGTFALPYTLPLESLWSIFTITNKLKYSSLFMLGNNIVVFLIVMVSMVVVDSMELRLIILASTRSICGLVRGFIFLPMYGAHCLGVRKTIFYKPVFKTLISICICIVLCYMTRTFIQVDSWTMLVIAGITVSIISSIVNVIIVLSPSDRKLIKNKLLGNHCL